jgi:hypothetical protein
MTAAFAWYGWISIGVPVAGLLLALLKFQSDSKRESARLEAESLKDLRDALAPLVPPLLDGKRRIEKYIDACDRGTALPSPLVSESVRDVVRVWESAVSPLVKNDAVKDAWKSARLSFLARRYDEATRTHYPSKEAQTEKFRAIAVRIRDAYEDVRRAIAGFVATD